MLQCGAIDWSQVLASPLSKMISTGSSLFPTQALCKFFEVSGSVSKFLALCYLITTEHLILFDKITAQKTVNFVQVLIQALRNGTKEGMLLSAIFVAKRLYLMLFSFVKLHVTCLVGDVQIVIAFSS
jgi:hypothetical protein